MKKVFKEKKSGFTLVETLVAISIFSVSLLGILSVLASGISDTTYAKRKNTAEYLAQEGIEYIRNMRDTYVLYSVDSETGWNSFNTKLSTNSCEAGHGCFFNADNLSFATNAPSPITQITLTDCKDTTCSVGPILYDSTTGKYNYTSGVNSGFTRMIKATPIAGSPDEIKIASTVFWTQGSGKYSTTFSEDLFNWVQ